MEHNGDSKWRLEQLLRKQKSKQKISYTKLFEECIEALGEGTIIMSEESSETIRNVLVQTIPFTSWGRIDWEKIPKWCKINAVTDALPTLKALNVDIRTPVYIIWGGNHPVLQTHMPKIIDKVEDVLAVDFDTYIYCPTYYVIEFYHEGEFTVGLT
ncbi:hypothetical protein ACE6ED_28510 [Paenibacillus sp. CN-4]|uniref:CDI toxin immunity protein n=1 Tax=Paenibacillus nanchangensis TaxID=3348343 RepID=UPI00397D96A1